MKKPPQRGVAWVLFVALTTLGALHMVSTCTTFSQGGDSLHSECSTIVQLLTCLTEKNSTFRNTLNLIAELGLDVALDSNDTQLTLFAAPDTAWMGPLADEIKQGLVVGGGQGHGGGMWVPMYNTFKPPPTQYIQTVYGQLPAQTMLYMMLPGGYAPEDLTNSSSLASALSETYAALENDADLLKSLPLQFSLVGADASSDNYDEGVTAIVQVWCCVNVSVCIYEHQQQPTQVTGTRQFLNATGTFEAVVLQSHRACNGWLHVVDTLWPSTIWSAVPDDNLPILSPPLGTQPVVSYEVLSIRCC